MRTRRLKENAVDTSEEKGTTKPETLNQQFNPGDLTWIEIHESSWWPAQVVDEDIVSDKPKKKSKNELLVRLYGTYQYMYVDASKSKTEFEEILKRENKTMKEKFQEAVEQDISLILPDEQSEPNSSKSKDIESGEAFKDKKQQSELTKELTGSVADEIEELTGKEANEIEKPTGKESAEIEEPAGKQADEIVTEKKAATKKENMESSSMKKRKLDFSKDEREERELQSGPSKAEAPYSKKPKVAKHAGTKNHESLKLRKYPRVSSVDKASSTKSVMEAPISEGEEVMKAKDLEIRKIVRDILFGRITDPPKDQSQKISKDEMQDGTSNEEASIMNCQNAAQKSGQKATYSRKNTSLKQGDGEIKCENRKNEGVEKVASEVFDTPNNSKRDGSWKCKKSNGEATANLSSRNTKGKGKAREDKTIHNVAQKSTSNLKHVQKESTKGNLKAKSCEETPATAKGTATPLEEKGSLSERQVRVMQTLALIAPAGSPFGRNGFII
ncbi:hypothetical protein LUZ63_000366 [Rhynchospora breviuscula]|uniref:PWWP domain-containing protein n=1 Tax=Rhynchospora breviuscula TaxID=2022672 RepID=A0A9Q0HW05_9POAL|nr:hypothetical protein LUZ63_000366 [Rhynchospora breviuscula]